MFWCARRTLPWLAEYFSVLIARWHHYGAWVTNQAKDLCDAVDIIHWSSTPALRRVL
jgi:P2-related tail formation protein